MSKKIPLGAALALLLAVIAATIAITMTVSMQTYGKLINNLSNRAERYDKIEELDEKVNQKYYGKIDGDKLNREVAKGYVSGLGDPHSRYLTADEYVQYDARIRGKASGIGIDTMQDPDSGAIYILRVYDGSPAKNNGLQRGDLIIQVGGEDVTAANYSELVGRLSGGRLSSVDLMYVRDGAVKPASIPTAGNMQTVFYETLGDVGSIRITAFFENTPAQLTEAIDKLTQAGAKSLLIDLRNNSEGALDYAVRALDLLVPMTDSGALATTFDREENVLKTFTSDAKSVALDIRLLVNGGTSGPAELFACDLRDFGKARLIGEQTAGRGTDDALFQLKDGSAVILTVSTVKPYKSESYDGTGLTPDVVVPLTQEQSARLELLVSGEDPQFQKGVSELTDTQSSSGLMP